MRLRRGHQRAADVLRLQAGALEPRRCGPRRRRCAPAATSRVRISSGGGSDANALIAQGFQTVNLANGTERNHEPGERVAAVALEEMLDVALALLGEVAALAPDGAL